MPPDRDSESEHRALHDREDWAGYRRLVIEGLRALREEDEALKREFREAVREVRDDLREVKSDVINLRVRAAGWGFVSGSLSAIIAALLQYLAARGH